MIELVVAVVIVAILAAIALPRFTSASENARMSAQHAAFLELERALELYHVDHGDWPPNSPVFAYPPELEPYLRTGEHVPAPALGEGWDWNGPGTGVDPYGYNLAIRGLPPPVDVWLEFDRRYDDGSLATGLYRRDKHYLMRIVSPP